MIIGQYPSKVDKNRRVAVPKQFRKELGKKFIISKWYEKCLVLVSSENFEELLNKVTGKMEMITSPVRDTDRFILGSAFEMSGDSQGRIVIPSVLSDFAKIKKNIVFLGLGNRVEMWGLTEWEKREQYIASHAESLVETMAKS